jgi:tetratricopeptide (TPR) repeat protein
MVALGSSCASKRYAKKGLKLEQAGQFEQAAQAYLTSLQSNRDNVDAQIGLKKNGQRVLDQKLLTVQSAYDANDDKTTVYNYLDAKSYYDLVSGLGVQLSLSERTTEMFKDAKPKYLEKIYNQAQLLLDDEKFKQSEELLAEIKQLEPGYGKSDEMMKVSKCEPLYRQGKEYLNTSLYRKAYANFDQIIRNHNSYKDSKDLRDESLNKGMITISLNKIENKTSENNIQTLVESRIKSSLNNLKNPFVKVLDSQNTNQLIQEQQKGLNQGSDIQVGKILAAKALFTGSVVRFDVGTGKLNKMNKRGYVKEEIVTKDAAGQDKKITKYHKVNYTEYKQSNQITCTFQYQLTSTETSAIIVSDAMDVNVSDEVYYAVFEGNGIMLIPGYWEDINKDSPQDKINDNSNDYGQLQLLLKARHSLKSVETLKAEVLDNIAGKVAQKINSYNPEE